MKIEEIQCESHLWNAKKLHSSAPLFHLRLLHNSLTSFQVKRTKINGWLVFFIALINIILWLEGSGLRWWSSYVSWVLKGCVWVSEFMSHHRTRTSCPLCPSHKYQHISKTESHSSLVLLFQPLYATYIKFSLYLLLSAFISLIQACSLACSCSHALHLSSTADTPVHEDQQHTALQDAWFYNACGPIHDSQTWWHDIKFNFHSLLFFGGVFVKSTWANLRLLAAAAPGDKSFLMKSV